MTTGSRFGSGLWAEEKAPTLRKLAAGLARIVEYADVRVDAPEEKLRLAACRDYFARNGMMLMVRVVYHADREEVLR